MTARAITVGGGAAGIFAAIRAAELAPDRPVVVLEKGRDLLQKVAISGGGRCNVTHDCRDPRELVRFYPRGGRELRGPFSRFAAQETIDWFAARGVQLKTEDDGRMFPVTDDSATVTRTLLDAARQAGVEILTRRAVRSARREGDGFVVTTEDGEVFGGRCLLIATGGMRGGGGRELAAGFGHSIVEPVPSLFTFHIDDPRLADLAGLSVPDTAVRVAGEKDLAQRGPLLVTHWGVSGPGVLKLSAWGARRLAELDYTFELVVDWLPHLPPDGTTSLFAGARVEHPKRHVATTPLGGLPKRLWERVVAAAGIPGDRPWAELRREESRTLARELREGAYRVTGKSLNKDEFVTCGGVPLQEVDLRRMESRLVPGLFFAGEVLDIDGVTGGFNLQAAWTGGWIAGEAMVRSEP
ncbi:MAG TPA: NAD(P)/FAD-dependent oxidoreductase [Candidatus Krumholzibacteria bacterium]|nr:NAD(P)/FAD-dependent oxidoreductase [Candidatus Krumholzibacteria bacterium]HPD72475.1 NAD(P)/FAD-dependent oxidoreductase [Candidatus Krumholzibacteria bacterium]HRY40593.1 NAD(P)/FAD-dependent oxidoreductase [Candidatus Krumholzibacteria bacterium]